jgi:uncharacterized membrane protein YpjA
MLWGLFWINFLGTIYGYEWYWNQMIWTVHHKPLWYVIFVPDSPTASLFFTISLLYLLYDQKYGSSREIRKTALIRGFVEAFALITSVKYGVWAVSMIAASGYLGEPITWQDWMLSISHLGMAAEALLFARWFGFRWYHIALVAVWILTNDYMDYERFVYPWLPDRLEIYLKGIQSFTIGLSIVCLAIACLFLAFNRSHEK